MKTSLTEQTIQRVLSGFFATNSVRYNIDGLYVFAWESDKLLKTKAGYYYEFEIKISRSDFKHDFTKADKHAILRGDKYMPKFWEYFELNKHRYPTLELWETDCRKHSQHYFCDHFKRPNYFYYAVPKDMVSVDEVPEYAGLIYIEEEAAKWDCHRYTIEKKAPCLHKEKYTDDALGLGEKFYYNMTRWRDTAHNFQRDYNEKCKELKEELASHGHEKTYEQLQRELTYALQREDALREEVREKTRQMLQRSYDLKYDDIERHLFMDELERLGVDVKQCYAEIREKATAKYKERYPYRN